MKKILLSVTMFLAVTVAPLGVSAEINESSSNQTAIKGNQIINITPESGMRYKAKETNSNEITPLSSVEGDFGYSALWWMESNKGLKWEVDPVHVDPYERDLVIEIFSQETGKRVKTIPITGYGILRSEGIAYYSGLSKGEYYAELSGTLEFVHGTSTIGDENGLLPGTAFVVR
ncbi:hypothetical protein [Brevibacillus brevis]|uniref:hypothetical protein n=1 Tax=Brevibacillus brevis TaxID=1393 RepID=UPI000D0E8F59|nr:hypothetical protein [Brevibacillus brevis]PSJ67264.1 hypothetical protein C7J99_21535 [Brevibacillus brevis]RED20953.1 hypothetical protein DES34_12617 [Brevibacillus brevis]GEC93588.1 hypothetical protein BBR01nite_59190 [Brevibacillus brevis]VEF92009.1 Uncharacterised protein [Brevibacillus brevis]